jgi:hypothetical protein
VPKPKPKRSIKPKASESSESSTKRPTSSPTPIRNPFDGTWRGFLNANYTMVISGTGTKVTQTTAEYGTSNWPATCDGVSMRWKTVTGCSATLTPNPDGKTAIVTGSCSGFLGIGAGNWSGVFSKISN